MTRTEKKWCVKIVHMTKGLLERGATTREMSDIHRGICHHIRMDSSRVGCEVRNSLPYLVGGSADDTSD